MQIRVVAVFLKKTGTGKRGNRKTAGTGKKAGKREIFKNNCYINFKNLWINNK
jgi:hypothetical protein